MQDDAVQGSTSTSLHLLVEPDVPPAVSFTPTHTTIKDNKECSSQASILLFLLAFAAAHQPPKIHYDKTPFQDVTLASSVPLCLTNRLALYSPHFYATEHY